MPVKHSFALEFNSRLKHPTFDIFRLEPSSQKLMRTALKPLDHNLTQC